MQQPIRAIVQTVPAVAGGSTTPFETHWSNIVIFHKKD